MRYERWQICWQPNMFNTCELPEKKQNMENSWKNIKKCTVNYCDDLRKCSWNHLEATWWQLLKAWPPRFSCFSGEPWRWINKSLNSTKNMTWRSSNQHKYVDVQKKVRGLLQPPIPPSFRNQSTGFARSRIIWLPEVCPTTWRAFHPPNPQVAAASSSP